MLAKWIRNFWLSAVTTKYQVIFVLQIFLYCKRTQKKSFWCLWTNLANFSSVSIVDFEQVNAIERMALITCVVLKLVCQTCKKEYFAKIVNCWKPSTAFLRKLYLRYLTWFCISLWKWHVARKSKIMVMIN